MPRKLDNRQRNEIGLRRWPARPGEHRLPNKALERTRVARSSTPGRSVTERGRLPVVALSLDSVVDSGSRIC